MLTGGLAVLTVGAELLVRGASALAVAARISPLVVGLTVVAYGTSAPELVVSLQATMRGQPDIALGNVIGSNNFNVLFILGISAAIIPLRVSQQLVRFEVPLMIGVSIVLTAMAWDGRLGRIDGLLLTTALLSYTVWGLVQSRREQREVQREYAAEFGSPETSRMSPGRVVLYVAGVVAGLLLLVVGARLFTDGAVDIARRLGVSELVIGLTIVAAGTSLPEVATSITAAIRGERDIAVGNVVGSNLFNMLGVLGISGLVSRSGIPVSQSVLQFDFPVMITVSVACLPIFLTGHLIARWEGFLFLGYFVAYTTFLILGQTNVDLAHSFAWMMGVFVLPLTAITLAVSVIRSRQWSRGGAESSAP